VQDIVIFDLSGTLSKRTPRPNDLARYATAIVGDSVSVVMSSVFYDHFKACRDMWIVSARQEEVREATEDWLYVQGIYYNHLLMRAAGDTRPGLDIKRQWLRDGTIPKERVLCAYEDDLDIANMYRAEGITCFHVLPEC
jgi:hypothetical protein